MTFLDYDQLAAIDTDDYQSTKPYPFANPANLLTPEAFETLRTALPAPEEFDRFFGKVRKAGQAPHDRLQLEYTDATPISGPWKEFIEELKADPYRSEMCRLFGVRSLSMNFHWHYTPASCSVSPHCDSRRKLGSHIFYFNTEQDWEAGWGGGTVVLDDGGRFPTDSAPKFEDFDTAIESEAMGNRSFLFTRRECSWHGVREIRCPEGHYRKVFIVVLNDDRWVARVRNAFQGKGLQRY